MRRVAILGSTGSIGHKALEVVADFPDRLRATALSTYSQVDLLAGQAQAFRPTIVNVTSARDDEVALLDGAGVAKITRGVKGLVELVEQAPADMLLVSTVGAVGIRPTLAAIDRGLDVALANKEVLVTAGELVMERARRKGVEILPIDSEHSAIAQCLAAGDPRSVRRLILTASGGPFRERDPEDVANVGVEEALDHPTWNMGPKITIDSATMMNKGFEVIEAMRLFGVDLDRIEVVVHPQSVIHSMVEFADGSIIAQMGVPDMYLPIQNALLRPDRVENKHPRLDFASLGALTFEDVSFDRFPCLRLSFEAARAGGTAPAVLNGANEVAVEAFLDGRIAFGGIPKAIEETLSRHDVRPADTLEAVEEADGWARRLAAERLTA